MNSTRQRISSTSIRIIRNRFSIGNTLLRESSNIFVSVLSRPILAYLVLLVIGESSRWNFSRITGKILGHFIIQCSFSIFILLWTDSILRLLDTFYVGNYFRIRFYTTLLLNFSIVFLLVWSDLFSCSSTDILHEAFIILIAK